MSALVELAWLVAGVAGGLAAYAAVCFALLFLVDLPDDPAYAALDDAVFLFTLPFVIALLGASLARSR